MLSPETTEDARASSTRTRSRGDARRSSVAFILRDHDDALLERARRAGCAARRRGRGRGAARGGRRRRLRIRTATCATRSSKQPEVVEAAEEAIRRVGLEPMRTLIRGGTDGSRLTEKGLPTPNLFTGGHHYHSEREWICVEDMGLAAAAIVELAQIWAE